MAAVIAVAVAVLVRDIPVGESVGLRRRFATLTNPRLVAGIIATLLVICGFNVVYIFSSSVTRAATADSGALLAVLLLIFGVAGIIGNVLAGRLTDRLGSRVVAGVFLGVQIVSLATLPAVAPSFVGSAIVFAVWGVAANGSLLPIQHRLIEVDPATAGVALSWYSTAMYAGIALAPPLGNAAMALAGPELVPIFGAIAVALALTVFQLGWVTRRISPVPSAVNRA
jgi:predicted MFS family arabinose efflux permease